MDGNVSWYIVFAGIQYAGSQTKSSVQMTQMDESNPGEALFEAGWPMVENALTGVYLAQVRVEERNTQHAIATKKLRSFAVYKKCVRISHLTIDRTFYNVGEPIQCELALENLSDRKVKDLRIEF